jgi:hypothetical protein
MRRHKNLNIKKSIDEIIVPDTEPLQEEYLVNNIKDEIGKLHYRSITLTEIGITMTPLIMQLYARMFTC